MGLSPEVGGGQRVQLRIADVVQDGDRVGDGVGVDRRGAGFDDMPEAGWVLRADRTGRGLAREAMTAALAWFDRQHGAQRIVCMVSPDNAPSLALADRLGFAPMREAQLPDGHAVRLYQRLPG